MANFSVGRDFPAILSFRPGTALQNRCRGWGKGEKKLERTESPDCPVSAWYLSGPQFLHLYDGAGLTAFGYGLISQALSQDLPTSSG